MKTKFFSKIALVLYFSVVGTVFSFGQKYEAELATKGGGAYFSSNDPGFSGTGFLASFTNIGDFVEFSITGALAGSQDVILHYTTGIAGSLNLYVNGTFIRQEAIPTTNGWSNWQNYPINVTLNAGDNTIKLIHEADNVGTFHYYIDYLTVVAASPVTGVTVSPTSLSINDVSSSQLTATVLPTDVPDKTVTWTSSNIAVATVSASGLVMGITVGNATITATTNDGNKTATCDVTVTATNTTRYEAEAATLTGLALSTDQSGYSGAGFVNAFANVGNNVQFSVPAATAGSYNVIFSYATGTGISLDLYVNDIMIKQLDLPSTGGWGNWNHQIDAITLNAGNNTIKYIKSVAGSTYLNADYIAVLGGTSTDNVSLNAKESDILLSQNPFSRGTLSIKLPESATQLSIFDVTGKVVYQKQVTKNEYLIDQSVFKTAGVYVVNIMTTTNSINKKVIVTK